MDRREAIKTAAVAVAVGGLPLGPNQATLICSEEFYHAVMPPTVDCRNTLQTNIDSGVNVLCVKRRQKWRIVDQMIEEQGGEV